MEHHFNVELAKQYGVLEAILMNHFEFWIAKNQANGRNYFDGTYWTYNSVKAFSELFPYATQTKIRNALLRLQEEGLIKTGNYNELAYDRTLWYAITEKGKCILQNCKMEISKSENASGDSNTAISDNNSNNNTNNKPNNRFIPPTSDEVRAYCRERNNNVDPERFVDYYTSNGWKVGKNQMKDWKAAVRTWERTRKNDTGSFETDEFFRRAVEKGLKNF